MKGFIKGSLWGLILGGAGLSAASLMNEQPQFALRPVEPALKVPEIPAETTAPALAQPVLPAAEEVPNFEASVPVVIVAPDAEASPEMTTEPAEAPAVAAVDAPAPSAATSAETPVLADDAVEPDDAEPLVTAAEEEAPVIAAPPAVVISPQTEQAATDAETTAPAPAAVVAPEPQEEVTAAAPAPSVSEEPVAKPDEPATQNAADAPTSESEVVAQEAPVVAEAPAPEPTDTSTPDQSAIVAQALPQASGGVRINRLGAEPQQPEASAPVADEAVAIPDDAPALLRFAAPYENTEGLPQIAVMLIDTGEMADAAAALSDLGFAPTVAVNALAEASEAKMAAYRAAGLEVALQADLPSGARPADVEVAFEAAFNLLPEAAMLFSLGRGAIEQRAVMAQVMQILAADGHGFVTVQRGLNDGTRAAEQAGVPATTILRDLDGEGESSGAISRALDQAAFRARQTGDVVILGRVTPATIEALRDWAAGLDQSTLSIAPVSAILLAQGE
jgi:polysaccharide deacetylase 2 family uncharacterized protein YibQ